MLKSLIGFKQAFEATVKDSFEDEVADSVILILKSIRLLDPCGGLKLRYNATREYGHGKKY